MADLPEKDVEALADAARESGVDYDALASTLDEFREMLRACVAGLRADGFTDREAHRLVTMAMTSALLPEVES